MKSTRTLIAVAGFAMSLLLFTGCEGGKGEGGDIPVDKERAKVHVIPIKQADSYRSQFAQAKTSLTRLLGDKDSTYLDKQFNMPVAEMFNRDAIALLLNQKGADGIRIYLGRDDQGLVRLVLLPVDKKGNDIRRPLLQNAASQAAGHVSFDNGAEAVEVGQRCPTACSHDEDGDQ